MSKRYCEMSTKTRARWCEVSGYPDWIELKIGPLRWRSNNPWDGPQVTWVKLFKPIYIYACRRRIDSWAARCTSMQSPCLVPISTGGHVINKTVQLTWWGWGYGASEIGLFFCIHRQRFRVKCTDYTLLTYILVLRTIPVRLNRIPTHMDTVYLAKYCGRLSVGSTSNGNSFFVCGYFPTWVYVRIDCAMVCRLCTLASKNSTTFEF